MAPVPLPAPRVVLLVLPVLRQVVQLRLPLAPATKSYRS